MPQAIYGEGGGNARGVDCLEQRAHCWSADCLLGTGGGWLPPVPADGIGDNRNQCPTVDCQGPGGAAAANLAAVDRWLCDPGACSAAAPCLWDVVADPQERHNLGADPQYAPVVESLRAILVSLNASVVPPYKAVKDEGGEMCRAFQGRGTDWPYFGPWKEAGVGGAVAGLLDS